MSGSRWRRGSIFWSAAAAAFVVILLVWILIARANVSSPEAGDDGAANTTGIDPDVVAALTVESATVLCTDVLPEDAFVASGEVRLVKPEIGALQEVPPRKWSDSLSTPLDPAELKAVQAAICQDPLLGATTANMLAGLKVGDVTLVSLNPWLEPFAGDPANINDTAAQYVPQVDGTVSEEAIAANLAWQEQAAYVNTLLSRFTVMGVQSLGSTVNYHLAGHGLQVNGLPEVAIDPVQDTKPALVLEVSTKNDATCVLRIGFNLGDKRPEVFACPAPPAPPAEQSPPPTETSTPPPGGSTPPPGSHTPGPTPTCPPEMPHGTPPNCKSGPRTDPQSQGNVPPQAVQTRPAQDNAAEVSRPAEQPVDAGNGIPATSTPRATPSPSSTPEPAWTAPSTPEASLPPVETVDPLEPGSG